MWSSTYTNFSVRYRTDCGNAVREQSPQLLVIRIQHVGTESSPMCRHSIHFYDDAYPAEAASDFIADGLLAGDTCIVMLSQPALSAVEHCLKAGGVLTGAAGACSGSYKAMDTHDALSQLVVEGRLDHERATGALGSLLGQARGGGRVRLVGDPAPVLFAAGNEEDAMALEGVVDRLAQVHQASVFCAYPIQGFCQKRNTSSLLGMSAHHSAVVFPERLWVQGYLTA
jgi:hypothetical protein